MLDMHAMRPPESPREVATHDFRHSPVVPTVPVAQRSAEHVTPACRRFVRPGSPIGLRSLADFNRASWAVW
jgi:hypothetical protein